MREWLADHTATQYPQIHRVAPVQRKPWGAGFSLWTKIALALLGLPLFFAGVLGMGACLYLLWAIFTSLLRT